MIELSNIYILDLLNLAGKGGDRYCRKSWPCMGLIISQNLSASTSMTCVMRKRTRNKGNTSSTSMSSTTPSGEFCASADIIEAHVLNISRQDYEPQARQSISWICRRPLLPGQVMKAATAAFLDSCKLSSIHAHLDKPTSIHTYRIHLRTPFPLSGRYRCGNLQADFLKQQTTIGSFDSDIITIDYKVRELYPTWKAEKSSSSKICRSNFIYRKFWKNMWQLISTFTSQVRFIPGWWWNCIRIPFNQDADNPFEETAKVRKLEKMVEIFHGMNIYWPCHSNRRSSIRVWFTISPNVKFSIKIRENSLIKGQYQTMPVMIPARQFWSLTDIWCWLRKTGLFIIDDYPCFDGGQSSIKDVLVVGAGDGRTVRVRGTDGRRIDMVESIGRLWRYAVIPQTAGNWMILRRLFHGWIVSCRIKRANMIDHCWFNRPLGPGRLFTRSFYTDCHRALKIGILAIDCGPVSMIFSCAECLPQIKSVFCGRVTSNIYHQVLVVWFCLVWIRSGPEGR